ncbi:hypothetical protein ABEF93_005223 [Exophiala dermatitidis]
MSSHPRRSARISHLQQEQFQQRTAAQSTASAGSSSQSSSASSSAHPSPVSDLLHPPPPPPTPQPSNPRLHIPPRLMPQQQQAHLHAPLPSPSAGEIEPFFGRAVSQSSPYVSQHMNAGYANQQRQQQPPQQNQMMNPQHHLHPHSNSMSQEHPAHSRPMNPGQLPPDFLAEAAKRAQMACLMRDLGEVSL